MRGTGGFWWVPLHLRIADMAEGGIIEESGPPFPRVDGGGVYWCLGIRIWRKVRGLS